VIYRATKGAIEFKVKQTADGKIIVEAWQQSALNQREYCEAHGIPLKGFGNWRAKFKAEPQPPVRKLLYRRRGFIPPA
jgi:hypothetical protein